MSEPHSSSPNTLPPQAILTPMLFGPFVLQSISVATRLGIPDLLAEQSRTAAELAEKTQTDAPSLYRVLRVLVSVDIFAEGADRKFESTPLSKILQKNVPGSMRDLVIMMGEEWLWRNWSALMHSVQTGGTAQEKVHGRGLFEFLAGHAEAAEIFNRAMTGISQAAAPAIVEAYDFSGVSKLIDIAGGHGILLAGILKANPRMRGILFDVPSVIQAAGECLDKEGVRDRVEFASGDFFQSVPEGPDVYLMKHIVHDWDEARAARLLTNVHAAMKGKGRLLLVESVVPETSEWHYSKMLDLEMLLTTGEKERTEREYNSLLRAAGFRMTRVVPTKSPFSVIESEPS